MTCPLGPQRSTHEGLVADVVANQGVSLVVDVSDLTGGEPDTIRDLTYLCHF